MVAQAERMRTWRGCWKPDAFVLGNSACPEEEDREEAESECRTADDMLRGFHAVLTVSEGQVPN